MALITVLSATELLTSHTAVALAEALAQTVATSSELTAHSARADMPYAAPAAMQPRHIILYPVLYHEMYEARD